MNKRLRMVLSGPGLIGKKHCALMRDHSDCMLVAVVAPDTPENRAVARAFGAAFHTSLEQAFATENPIDAAIISSPNEVHFDQAVACVSRRVPILVEKPITDTLARARTLAEMAEKAGVPVLVGHHRMHSTLLAAANRFLSSSRFGRLVSVTGSAQFYKPAQYFVEGDWRSRIGGGPILINLIHEIGLMRHFCGEISAVVALAANAVRGFEVEDSVAISLRFANGALGTFMLCDTAASSKSWEMTAGENPAYPFFPDEDCYHFAGTTGSLDFPSMRARSYVSAEAASWWKAFEHERLEVERADPLAAQLDHFVAVIRGQAQPRVTASDGYRNMLVIEAIVGSIRDGRIVSVAELEAV